MGERYSTCKSCRGSGNVGGAECGGCEGTGFSGILDPAPLKLGQSNYESLPHQHRMLLVEQKVREFKRRLRK